MGGRVASQWSNQRRLPEICQRTTGSVRTGNIRVGVLDPEEREQPLEPGVDDQQWLHQALIVLPTSLRFWIEYGPESLNNQAQIQLLYHNSIKLQGYYRVLVRAHPSWPIDRTFGCGSRRHHE